MNQAGVPAQIGRYPVERLLARGGMGTVYLARHPDFGYEVAIKAILAGQNASDDQRRRFRREVAALVKLQHPGLVRVYEAGEEQGIPWFAMSWVEGTSLADRLHREGPLPPDEVFELAGQLCAALSAVHGAGILHRDLKPDNVLCTPSGQFVLTDFGLAKDLEVEESVRLSRTGIMQGTPGFWSPEQAAGAGGSATAATDVYGLGATLYAALTGQPPVDGDTWLEVLVATQETPPTSLRSLRPEVPEWLERVVLRCLEKKPEDRYQSMEELTSALGRSGAPPAKREAEAAGRRFVLPVGLSLAAVAALSIAVASAPGERENPTKSPAASDVEGPATVDPVRVEIGGPVAPTEGPPAESAELLYARGRELALAANFVEALPLFRRAAELGHPAAMNDLGSLFAKGQGVEIDDVEAVRWYRRAAELGEPAGMHSLGVMLTSGRGVERDEAEAVRWYRRAAELGEPSGMHSLGFMLAKGRGVEEDVVEAAGWYRRAAELGNAQAAYNLGVLLERGLGIEKNEAEAVRWYRRAAELGNANAANNLGTMLAKGKGVVEPDEAEAAHWFRRAAELGNIHSMFSLGAMSERGLGVKKDEAEAARWYRRAAALGHVGAMANLGFMLATGQGIEKDEAEAARWYRRAAEQGDLNAMVNLAIMLEGGRGVEKDEAEAVRLYRRSLQSTKADPGLKETALRALRRLGQEP